MIHIYFIQSLVTALFYIVFYRNIKLQLGENYLGEFIATYSIAGLVQFFSFGINGIVLSNREILFLNNTQQAYKSLFFGTIYILFGVIIAEIALPNISKLFTDPKNILFADFSILIMVLGIQNIALFVNVILDVYRMGIQKSLSNVFSSLTTISLIFLFPAISPSLVLCIYFLTFLFPMCMFIPGAIHRSTTRFYKPENIPYGKLILNGINYQLTTVPSLLFDPIIKSNLLLFPAATIIFFDFANRSLQLGISILLSLLQSISSNFAKMITNGVIKSLYVDFFVFSAIFVIFASNALSAVSILYMHKSMNFAEVLILSVLTLGWYFNSVSGIPYTVNLVKNKLRDNLLASALILTILIGCIYVLKLQPVYSWSLSLIVSSLFLNYSFVNQSSYRFRNLIPLVVNFYLYLAIYLTITIFSLVIVSRLNANVQFGIYAFIALFTAIPFYGSVKQFTLRYIERGTPQ